MYKSISLKLILLFVLTIIGSESVSAGWKDDLYKAQDCLNRSTGRNVMHCMRYVNKHDNWHIRFVKCSIWLNYHGYDLLNSPLITFETGGETTLMVMNGFTDFDITEAEAKAVAYECENSIERRRNGRYKFITRLVGAKYMKLKSYILSFSNFNTKNIVINAKAIQDQNIILKIENTIRELKLICSNYDADAPLPLNKTAWCSEILKLKETSNTRLFDSLIRTMHVK